MINKYRVNALGKLLSRLPKNIKLLYPLYQAAQLNCLKYTFVCDRLPEEWSGFTIAYASDIHYGPMFSKERAIALIDKLNGCNADIVLLGGDYGEITQTAIDFFQTIPNLHAKFGVLAAIGNHDLNGTPVQVSELKQLMTSRGIIPLQNECHLLQGQKSALRFCSTDDTRHGQPDISILMKDISPETFTIFFPHSPDILPSLTNSGRKMFDLALCGHTHGGQIAFFGRSLHSSSKFGDRYRTGWMQENGHDIMVSNGVGTSLIPVRIGAPPQYHIITLKRKED